MTGTIYTKLHTAMELINRPGIQRQRGQQDYLDVSEALHAMMASPLFVMDFELSRHLDMTALSKSVTAIKAAGRLKLPYPRIALELWINWHARNGNPVQGHRLFALVDEVGLGRWDVAIVEYQDDGKSVGVSTIFRTRMDWIDGPLPGVPIYPPPQDHTDPDNMAGFAVSWDEDAPAHGNMANKLIHEISIGLIMGIMMTNIAGVEREVIEPKRSFNKARQLKGRHAIPNHTVVRIGHTFTTAAAGRSASAKAGVAGRWPSICERRTPGASITGRSGWRRTRASLAWPATRRTSTSC